MNYIYLIGFILAMPLVWFILLASNLDRFFKQGKIWQIRVAYVILTLILSHLLAFAISYFVQAFQTPTTI